MTWIVRLHREFAAEVEDLPVPVVGALAFAIRLLGEIGPGLGRPTADTLKGSRHANMKELRFSAAGGVWRIAFAFDPERSAVLLVAGNKSGQESGRFYRDLIRRADARMDSYLEERS